MNVSDRVRNVVVWERYALKEDVVTRMEKGMPRWFGHWKRLNNRRLTIEIYRACLWKWRKRSHRPLTKLVCSEMPWEKQQETTGTGMQRLMNVDDQLSLPYPEGNRCDSMYVCFLYATAKLSSCSYAPVVVFFNAIVFRCFIVQPLNWFRPDWSDEINVFYEVFYRKPLQLACNL